eukprot:360666-Chlamydomonas_euryale.AAC.10
MRERKGAGVTGMQGRGREEAKRLQGCRVLEEVWDSVSIVWGSVSMCAFVHAHMACLCRRMLACMRDGMHACMHAQRHMLAKYMYMWACKEANA